MNNYNLFKKNENDVVIHSNNKIDLQKFLEIPKTVQRSTSAEVFKGFNPNDKKANSFGFLRNYYGNFRVAWQNALKEYEFVINNNQSFGLYEKLKNLEETSNKYFAFLLWLAEKTGIWNCGEFADFALIKIQQSGILSNEYTVRTGILNNISKSPYGDNHDHVFVAIDSKLTNSPVFIIDLWQQFAGKKPFIGKPDAYINYLNKNVGNRYVQTEVKIEDLLFNNQYSNFKKFN